MKRILLILAITTMATSITSLPAQAFTWDDAWNAIKRGAESSLSKPPENTGAQSPQDNTGNQLPQPNPLDSSSNGIPSPSIPSNFSSPPKPKPRVSCIAANNNIPQIIGRDDSDAMISAGRRTVRPSEKVSIGWANYERTCRIVSEPPSGKISRAFAIADGSSLASARVTIYVDGQEKISSIIYQGQIKGYTFDVAGASNYAVVVKSLDGSGDIYMIPMRQPQ